MKSKMVIIFIFIIQILFADGNDKLALKIERALACNAKFGYVEGIQITNIEKSIRYKDKYYVEGIYKYVLSISTHIKYFSIGDEFHPQSASFIAIVDEDLNIIKLKWKAGFLSQYVTNECLNINQKDI